MAHGLTRFVAVVLSLTGFAVIVGVIVTTLGAGGSRRDAVAGTMWFVGLIALLVVPGQLWGRIWAGIDDESDTSELVSEVSWMLIPVGLAVMAIGTIVYVLF